MKHEFNILLEELDELMEEWEDTANSAGDLTHRAEDCVADLKAIVRYWKQYQNVDTGNEF